MLLLLLLILSYQEEQRKLSLRDEKNASKCNLLVCCHYCADKFVVCLFECLNLSLKFSLFEHKVWKYEKDFHFWELKLLIESEKWTLKATILANFVVSLYKFRQIHVKLQQLRQIIANLSQDIDKIVSK